jgi:hypothetical protein
MASKIDNRIQAEIMARSALIWLAVYCNPLTNRTTEEYSFPQENLNEEVPVQ